MADLTPHERRIFWGLAAFSAATRFLAMAHSMWDWDEALFCLGMRHYDVTQHHPHPPGFPVYIGAAKLVRFIVPSDFRALQALNLVAGILVFPAIFLLARELRLKFETSIVAATLFAFFPNVWFFGGTAFSDVPSIVLVMFAVIFLLPAGEGGRRPDEGRDFGPESRPSPGASRHPLPLGEGKWRYFLGTFLLALAIGIRPQNLLVGLFPGALATWRRPWRDVAVALAIGVVVCAAAYGGAIHATGTFDGYMTTIRAHGDYIARIDSFRSPDRPALWRLFDRFFLKQYESPALSILVSIFVVISWIGAIVKRDRAMLWNLLTWGPFAVAAWLMLDRYSINRFSIGYAPMFAIFAADGICRVARGRTKIEYAIGGVIAAAFFIWTLPALTPVRRDDAPSVKAVETAVQTIKRTGDNLFVGYSMTPFIEYMAPDIPITRVMDDRAIPLTPSPRPLLLAEVNEDQPGGIVFRRERGRLWDIARRHYFEVAVRPMTNIGEFGPGWYPAEGQGMDEWRWMSGDATVTLRPASGDTVLRLYFYIPGELVAKHPLVAIALNGKELDRFTATEEYVSRDYHVTPNAAGPNVVRLTVDQTIRNQGDTRPLGLQVRFISWGPG